MIIKMQKVTLVCLGHDTESTLGALQEMGVLHLTHTVTPQGDDLAKVRKEQERAKKALHALTSLSESADPSDAPSADLPAVPETHDIPATVDQLLDSKQKKTEERVQLLGRIAEAEPYGHFDPALIRELSAKGVSVRLFQSPKDEVPDAPQGASIVAIHESGDRVYFALLGAPNANIAAAEFTITEHSLAELRGRMKSLDHSLGQEASVLRSYVPELPALAHYCEQLEERVAFAEAQAGMGADGQLAYIQGFCPEEQIEALQSKARVNGWALLSEEPGDDEPVPTLLRYPRWVRPIKAMYDGLSILPGYREADISAVFLVFFSIFFALLIGDAGYGILFLAATILARKKFPKAPAYPFALFGILSTCTIIWGALTGNYFGISPDLLPGALNGLRVPWLSGEDAQRNVMRLCFLIGAVHLTIAHVWNAITLAPSPMALAEIGWIAIAWSMFLVALNMVLQVPLPGFFIPMLVSGITLVILFMTPPKKLKAAWIHHAMLPLSVVNCFVDIVSYIRLFAVGLASLSVAQSFNGMAADIGISKVWTIPFFALILLFGHGLNIILCALGILVHGVRLNTLEFSLHKNMEWKGFAYRPFGRRT